MTTDQNPITYEAFSVQSIDQGREMSGKNGSWMKYTIEGIDLMTGDVVEIEGGTTHIPLLEVGKTYEIKCTQRGTYKPSILRNNGIIEVNSLPDASPKPQQQVVLEKVPNPIATKQPEPEVVAIPNQPVKVNITERYKTWSYRVSKAHDIAQSRVQIKADLLIAGKLFGDDGIAYGGLTDETLRTWYEEELTAYWKEIKAVPEFEV